MPGLRTTRRHHDRHGRWAARSGLVRSWLVFLTAALAMTMASAVVFAAPRNAQAQNARFPSNAIVATDGASAVVNGVVVAEATSITTLGGMHLVAEVEISSVVHGDSPERILVEVPGGVQPNGMRQIVAHQPAFRRGDTVQIAVRPAPRVEAGVIGAVHSDERLPVYSLVGGMAGTAFFSGVPRSQLEAFMPGTANAKGSFALHGGEWSQFPVDYVINPAGGPSGSAAAIRNAMSTWALDGTTIDLTYAGTTSSTGAAPDYENVVSFVTPTNPADTFLAQATWWMIGSSEIVAFDIEFNRNYDIVVGAQPGAFDLESIALHEMGHVLGLGHIDSPAEVMFPTITDQTLMHQLGAGDTAGVRSLYLGAEPTATSTAVPTATSTAVPTATSTPVPTATSTAVPTATSTPSPTATSTPEPTATSTPRPTATATPIPTATSAPTPSPTPMPPAEPGAIIGDVRVLADNQPIFGARVCARSSFVHAEFCSLSNMTGRFRIAGIPAGNYSVHVTDRVERFLPNCAGTRACTDPTRFGITDTQGAVLSHVSLDPKYNQTVPTPTPDVLVGEAVLTGRVFDSNGAPTQGSEVCVEGLYLSIERCATTNSNGEYEIRNLPTGNYRVQFADGSCYGALTGCIDPFPVGVVSPSTRHNISAELES